MKNDLLQEFKREYEKKLEEKQKNDKALSVLMDRKKILENSPLIKHYIELNEQIDSIRKSIQSVEDIFLETLYKFESQGLTVETNNIYYYLGSFYIDEHGKEYQVDRDDVLIPAMFNRYINIESKNIVYIPIEDVECFENDNKVIVSSNLPDMLTFSRTRKDFINDALYEGQEVACKRILSRNKKNL